LYFVHMQDAGSWATAFETWCEGKTIDRTQLNGSFEYSKTNIAMEDMKSWYAQSRVAFPRYRILTIDAVGVHEMGGSIVHELMWALAAGHSALATLRLMKRRHACSSISLPVLPISHK